MATDINLDTANFGFLELPEWLTLNDNDNGTAMLHGTPTINDMGYNQVILTATDGIIQEPVLQTFTINVVAFNGTPENEPSQLVIYPDPVSDFLYVVNGSESKIASMVITNSAGTVVFQTNRAQQDDFICINVSSWTPGLYFLRIIAADNTPYSRKVVVH
jgi:hypothetical protein